MASSLPRRLRRGNMFRTQAADPRTIGSEQIADAGTKLARRAGLGSVRPDPTEEEQFIFTGPTQRDWLDPRNVWPGVARFKDDFNRVFDLTQESAWDIVVLGTASITPLNRSGGWWSLSVGPGDGRIRMFTKYPILNASTGLTLMAQIWASFAAGRTPESTSGVGVASSIRVGFTDRPLAPNTGNGTFWFAPEFFNYDPNNFHGWIGDSSLWADFVYPRLYSINPTDPHKFIFMTDTRPTPYQTSYGPGHGIGIVPDLGLPGDTDPGFFASSFNTAYHLYIEIGCGPVLPVPPGIAPAFIPATHPLAFELDLAHGYSQRGSINRL